MINKPDSLVSYTSEIEHPPENKRTMIISTSITDDLTGINRKGRCLNYGIYGTNEISIVKFKYNVTPFG